MTCFEFDLLYIHVYTFDMLLYQISDIFKAQGLSYALVGGYALALHGIVRATVDIDIVLSLRLADFQLAEKCLGQLGLKSRLPIRAEDVIKMRKEYIQNRNLIAWSFVDYSNPIRQLDVLIIRDLKKLETVEISVAGRKIPVATLEELLKMKLSAGRPQDLVDVDSIKRKLYG
jgi:Nucleotidyl transferase AbiEii toxin, Type IV TA system